MPQENKNHPIFNRFQRQKVIGMGGFTYDFLGIATDSSFKTGWSKFALPKGKSAIPNYPPLNEHYFDWISILTSVVNANEIYRMAELGAGYAPWLVSAAFASRQIGKIKKIELLGIEADEIHYEWMKKHFLDNGLNPDHFNLIRGAISLLDGYVKFPKIETPDQNYGASIRENFNNTDYVEVKSYQLNKLTDKFSGVIDLLHVDIQGVEYDVIPPNIELLTKKVKMILIGTHLSKEKHIQLRNFFPSTQWSTMFDFLYKESYDTPYGKVQFSDGLLVFVNKSL